MIQLIERKNNQPITLESYSKGRKCPKETKKTKKYYLFMFPTKTVITETLCPILKMPMPAGSCFQALSSDQLINLKFADNQRMRG